MDISGKVGEWEKFLRDVRKVEKRTVKAYVYWVRKFLKEVEEVEEGNLVEKYREFLMGKKLRRSTVRLINTALCNFFSYLGWDVSELKRERPKPPEFSPRELPKDVAEFLINYDLHKNEYLNLRDRVMIALALATGLRRSEIASLHEEDVDLENGVLWVKRKGREKKRPVVLTEKAKEILKNYLERTRDVRTSGYVFTTLQGGPISPRTLDYIFNAKMKALAKIRPEVAKEGYTLHKTRHTFAFRVFRATKDILYLKEAMDVKTLNVLLAYARTERKRHSEILEEEVRV